MPDRAFGLIGHCAGGVSALVVFAFAAQIATVFSDLASSATEMLAADGSMGFVAFEMQGSILWLVPMMCFLGFMVAGLDRLVSTKRVRPLVPPLAVPTVSVLAVGLLAGDGVGWQGRVSIAAGLGGVLGLAFDVWWFASGLMRRLRRRIQPVQGMV